MRAYLTVFANLKKSWTRDSITQEDRLMHYKSNLSVSMPIGQSITDAPCKAILTIDKDELRDSTLETLSTLIKTSKKCIKEAPGTGAAFLQTKKYEDWVIGPASFLWLYGKPGTGKTILLSALPPT